MLWVKRCNLQNKILVPNKIVEKVRCFSPIARRVILWVTSMDHCQSAFCGLKRNLK